MGTDVGLYIYYPEKDSFEHFTKQSVENTRIEHTVTAISGDNQGCVWMAVESQGLFCYNLEKESFRTIPYRTSPFLPPMLRLLLLTIAEPFGSAVMAMDFSIRKTV